mmetsp:Transcript_27538/g.79813  ORF Transcript_27538/g.79813 Transcript_27538/m.79813 type:complete len:205 (-) Transcript_27538:851-1465(-)
MAGGKRAAGRGVVQEAHATRTGRYKMLKVLTWPRIHRILVSMRNNDRHIIWQLGARRVRINEQRGPAPIAHLPKSHAVCASLRAAHQQVRLDLVDGLADLGHVWEHHELRLFRIGYVVHPIYLVAGLNHDMGLCGVHLRTKTGPNDQHPLLVPLDVVVEPTTLDPSHGPEVSDEVGKIEMHPIAGNRLVHLVNTVGQFFVVHLI